MSLKNVAELFRFKEWLKNENNFSDSTAYLYFYSLKKYFVYCKGDTLDIENLNWFMADFAHKRRSTYYFSVLKKYIKFKTLNNIKLREELYDKLLKPKSFKDIKMERRYLPDDKLIQIVNKIDDKVFSMVAVLQFLTAARAGGILSIQRDGITEEVYQDKPVMRIVTLEKRSKRRVIYLFDKLGMAAIKEYLAWYDIMKEDFYEDYIFIRIKKNNRMGNITNYFDMKKMTYLQYWRELKTAITESGMVPKKFFATHDFRRCFSRKVWEKYKDVNILQRVLDHEDPSTTLRYLKQSGLQNIDIFKELQS